MKNVLAAKKKVLDPQTRVDLLFHRPARFSTRKQSNASAEMSVVADEKRVLVPCIMAMLSRSGHAKSHEERDAGVVGFGKLGPTQQTAQVGKLIELLGHPNEGVRYAALGAFSMLNNDRDKAAQVSIAQATALNSKVLEPPCNEKDGSEPGMQAATALGLLQGGDFSRSEHSLGLSPQLESNFSIMPDLRKVFNPLIASSSRLQVRCDSD